MPHCRTSFVRICAKRAELVGVDVLRLLSKHGLARSRLEEAAAKTPWSFFVELLDELERAIGGARAVEQFGAETGAAHPLFAVLKSLHFSLEEIQSIAVERLLPSLFSGVLLPLVRAQPDGSFRVTLSLNRDVLPSYPFWTLLLGMARPLPRLFGQADSLIEVEVADRFAEFLIILPVTQKPDKAYGREIRRNVREHLLKDLVAHEELFELPTPDLGSSMFERRLEAAAGASSHRDVSEAMQGLEADILELLQVDRLGLYELTPVGGRRVSCVGGAIAQARLRRVLWLNGDAVGLIEVPRSGEEGHSRVASLLDEHIDTFAYRFAQVQNRLPRGVTEGGFTQAPSPVGDPTTVEPPPSSRGRVARAARDGRLNELTAAWQLTERQRAVLALLVEGHANKEIAARLTCSVGTIENHVTRLLKSAAVDCRAALTALFWRTR